MKRQPFIGDEYKLPSGTHVKVLGYTLRGNSVFLRYCLPGGEEWTTDAKDVDFTATAEWLVDYATLQRTK